MTMSIASILFLVVLQLSNRVVSEINEDLYARIKPIGLTSISVSNDLCETTTWTQIGTTLAGGNHTGSELNQLYTPNSFFIDTNQSFYIADTYNNRVVKWIPGASQGEIVAGSNTSGSGNYQLYLVQNVVVKSDGTMFICDRENQRVMRWYKDEKQGQTIIQPIDCFMVVLDGQESLYILTRSSVIKWYGNEIIINDITASYTNIFIDKDQSVFVSDYITSSVLKYPMGAKEGIVVAGNGTAGNGTNQLNFPKSIFVDAMENVYVLDKNNYRIVRWLKGSNSGSIILGGPTAPLSYDLNDFSFGRHGNLYVLNDTSVIMYTIDKNTCIQG